jgi:hypothetical protein
MSTVDTRSSSFDDKTTREDEMQDSIEEWIDDLVDAIEEERESEEFQRWLDCQSHFHDYSLQNTLLILKQYPKATQVATYNTWENEFDRHVKEGESAIWIWRPNTFTGQKCPHCGNAPNYHPDNETLDCPYAGTEPSDWDFDPEEEWERGEILMGFSPYPVFDVSQTEGEELPSLDYAAHGDPGDLIPQLLDAAEELEAKIEIVDEEDWDRSSKGVCRYEEGEDGQDKIEVKQRDNKADLASTLIHELAHSELHSDVDGEIERSKREVEAESTAYIVGKHFGLDVSGSAVYLAAWENEPESIRDRLERISKTAQDIIGTIEN